MNGRQLERSRTRQLAICVLQTKPCARGLGQCHDRSSDQVIGISMNTDGSEDGEIHCIKESQIAAEAFPIIAEKTGSLFEDSSEDDCDPFAESDLEDEDELADNELTVDDS